MELSLRILITIFYYITREVSIMVMIECKNQSLANENKFLAI